MRNFWQFKNLGENSAELYLYGEIVSEEPWFLKDCVSYRNFINDLKALGDCNNITVYINSGGGDVFAANAIYSQLKKHKAVITVEIEGICASAATVVAMAGDTIKAEKNSLIMIHNPSVGLMGYFDEDELEKCKNSVNAVKRSIIEAYLSKIDKTEEELSSLMDNETWYTGSEALDAGIVDEVFENLQSDEFLNCAYNNFVVINNFVCDIGKFKNFPKNKIKTNNFNKLNGEKVLRQPFFNEKTKNEEVTFMTLGEIKNKYPDIYNEIGKEAVEKERERLKAIDEISANISEDLVMEAKYTDCISAQELALTALKGNKILSANSFSDVILDNQESNVKKVDSQNSLSAETSDRKTKISGLVNFLNKGSVK